MYNKMLYQVCKNRLEEIILYKAGFWIRLGAGILDSLIISIPVLILPVYWIGKRICGIRIQTYDTHEPPKILFHKTRILYICIYPAKPLIFRNVYNSWWRVPVEAPSSH